jgi:hypothetical protein
MNFIIGIVAVNEKYINYTKNLIISINKINPNILFLVLTNKPTEFTSGEFAFINIVPINYNKHIFSYHDKMIVLKEGLKIKDIVLLLDADNEVKNINNSALLENLIAIESGIYPHFLWNHPADCSIENFLQGKTPRVPYGLLYKEFCIENNLKTDNCSLMQESFILIKKDKTNEKNIDNFFRIWEQLADFCNTQDIKRNQHILGYGEGYSIAIAALNSGLNVITNKHDINIIKDKFQHFAWK